MPSSSAFKDYVLECLESSTQLYSFSVKKMFGEYCIYVYPSQALLNSYSKPLFSIPKPLFLLCDDTLFIKQYKELASLLKFASKAPPFKGAKEWYVVDVDSSTLLQELVETIAPLLPEVKPKKRPKK